MFDNQFLGRDFSCVIKSDKVDAGLEVGGGNMCSSVYCGDFLVQDGASGHIGDADVPVSEIFRDDKFHCVVGRVRECFEIKCGMFADGIGGFYAVRGPFNAETVPLDIAVAAEFHFYHPTGSVGDIGGRS